MEITNIIYADTETFSPVPISHGTHAYAEQAELLLVSYAIDDHPVRVIDFTTFDENPAAREEWEKLKRCLQNPKYQTVWQNGGGFDRIILRHVEKMDLILENLHDTSVQALSASLPGGLEDLCKIFRLDDDIAKIKDGKRLIQLFTKPLGKNRKLDRATRHTHPADWEKFKQYAINDISSMRELYKKMPKWNYHLGSDEHKLWCLDQKINDFGFYVDQELVDSALEAVNEEKKILSERIQEMTDGALRTATQREALKKYLARTYQVYISDTQKPTLERVIADDDTPEGAKELLRILQQAGTSSTSKFNAFKRCVSSDGRLRGSLKFDGASRTGRWSGKNVQPQNFPRPDHSLSEDDLKQVIEDVKNGSVGLIHNNVMKLASSCVRGCIAAPKGKKLVVSDLSNIEGRVAAWLAGEDWKVKAFNDFDAGTGHDLYKIAYAKSFGVDPSDVDKDQRQVGKVQELALQYEGGVGAFVTFADTYGIDLQEMARTALPNIPVKVLNQARKHWGWAVNKNSTHDLDQDTFVACDALKRLWREAHPEISGYWSKLKNAVIRAILNPNVEIPCGRVTIDRRGAWLRIQLPSGRYMCYPSPELDDDKITYAGVNQYSKKWGRISSYGGKFFENICQAVARDVMASNMFQIDAEGYKMFLSVHDELLTETPDTDEYSEKRLSEILATNPEWAPDLPLAAAGYEDERYKKD